VTDLAKIRVLLALNQALVRAGFKALRVGASGFLVKSTEPVELIRGVRAVASGDALLSLGSPAAWWPSSPAAPSSRAPARS